MANATIRRWLGGAVLLALVGATAAAQGLGISGTIGVVPAVVNAGDPTMVTVTYLIRNDGGGTLFDVPIIITLVDPDTGDILATLNDIATLPGGGAYANLRLLPTAGLAPKTYLVVLEVILEGPLRLATATLQVISAPLDCTRAGPSVGELWPPNHKFVRVSVSGVTDAAGDPAAVTIDEVFQDEPTNAAGDANTCPDVAGTGTSEVRVRAERSGTRDGRVYHLRFTASDGRGGTCQAEVTVCVPHDQGDRPPCVDQGPLFNSAVCPAWGLAPDERPAVSRRPLER